MKWKRTKLKQRLKIYFYSEKSAFLSKKCKKICQKMVWNFLRLASLRLTCVSQFKHEKTLCNPLHWKNYKCKICLATFAKSHQLSSHMDSHTKENKHKCSICSFSFRGKKSFKRHMWKQTGTQPFHCTFCSSSFSRKDVLKCFLCYSKKIQTILGVMAP